MDTLVLVPDLDLVRVEQAIVGCERPGEVRRLQDVRLTRTIRSEHQRLTTVTGDRRGVGQCVRADGNLREALTFRRNLTALINAPGQTRFGVEERRPLRVQLDGVVVFFFVVQIGVGVVLVRGCRCPAALPDGRGGATVGRAQTLVVIDVVVELDRRLFIENRLVKRKAGRLQQAGGRVVVPGAQQRCKAGLGGRRVGVGNAEALAGRTRRGLVEALVLFIRGREEQLVGDDWAGDERAVVLVVDVVFDLRRGRRERQVARRIRHGVDGQEAVPDQAGGAVEIEHRTVEVVGARLHDHVDRAAGEVTVFHVERRGLGRDLLKRFQRDRTAVGGEAAGVQTVVVLRANAVDGDPVAARRGAGDGQTARWAGGARHKVELGQRIAAGDVADVAANRNDSFDIRCADRRARADIGEVRVGLLLGVDGDGRHNVRSFEVQGHAAGVANLQVDVIERLVRELRRLADDLVGAAEAKAADVEHAGGVGDDRRLGARRRVNDQDRRTLHRRASFVQSDAAQGSRRLLRERGRSRKCEQNSA